MKKQIITLLLIITTLISLTACGAAGDEMKGEMAGPPNDMVEGAIDNMWILGDDGDLEEIEPDDKDYGKLIENPYIQTSTESVSTFAADVDTAAYAYFRRLVNDGYTYKELIATAGSSMRTEEMVNYFDYGYAEPADGELFATTMQIAPCPWNEQAELLVLGLQAKRIEAAPKNNLVFLIDVSGSMDSVSKLGLLKKAFAHLIDKLDEDDTVSIVTYSDEAKVVLDGCSGAKKDMIYQAVNSLWGGGATNGEAGIQRAYQLAESHFIQNGNNRIIMASDGDLNVGVSTVEELEQLVAEKRQSGVFLSVLGFGTGNYKDAQMETIANKGNGVYYYIDGEAEAEKVFGTDLLSTLYTVAKDVKLQLSFNPKAVSAYRLIGYENRLLNKEDYLDDTKDAGELGAGHSLTVCYELVLTENAIGTDERWMTLGVRYKAPDGDKSEGEEYTFGKEVYTEAPDDSFKFVSSVAATAMILHGSEHLGNTGLNNVKETLDSLAPFDDKYKQQFKELIDKLYVSYCVPTD